MKKITNKVNQVFIIIYTSIYILFFMVLMGNEIRDLFIKSDYAIQRYEGLYSNPVDSILGLTILFIISAFPLIVMTNILIILKKIIKIEEKLTIE